MREKELTSLGVRIERLVVNFEPAFHERQRMLLSSTKRVQGYHARAARVLEQIVKVCRFVPASPLWILLFLLRLLPLFGVLHLSSVRSAMLESVSSIRRRYFCRDNDK